VLNTVPVSELGLEHSKIVINAALASVSVSFPAAQRIESELNRGPSKIKKDSANSLIVHEHAAMSLPFMMVPKIILG
jgi:hypothetical protein